jgi:DNA-binding NtrC family response regulator
VVGLYDPDPKKRLLGFLAENRIDTTLYDGLTELNAALRRDVHRVAVVALETIGADAKKRLEELRAGAPKSRVVLVHDESTPRARFAQRLWVTGACDVVVSRSQASALQETIQRFEMEARLEAVHRRSLREEEDAGFLRFRAMYPSGSSPGRKNRS